MHRLFGVTVLFILLSWGNDMTAQYIEARLQADTTDLRIGETVDLTISVSYDPGLEVYWPLFQDTLGGMEILETQESVENQQANGRTLVEQQLTLISFDSGYYRIPSLDVNYSLEGDTAVKSIFTNAVNINVFTVEIDTTQGIKPIKDIVEVPITLGEIAAWGGLILLIAAIIGGIVWYLRKRQKVEEEEPRPTYRVPPYEVAMRRLAQLEEKRIWQKGEIKAYYIELTDAIRTYIEEELKVPAMESVTHEIISDLRRIELPEKLILHLKSLLEMADLAKFAKFRPEPEDNLLAMDQGRNFLKDSRSWHEAHMKSLKEQAAEEAVITATSPSEP